MLEEVMLERNANRPPRPPKTLIEASEEVLRAAGRPLHAYEIAHAILISGAARLSGATPWKTVTSRLSMDIRNHAHDSQFQRDGHARFALREWGTPEFHVNRRKINPIDETIKVVPKAKFTQLLQRCKPKPLYRLKVDSLIEASIPMRRAQAEETTEVVQLIPTFIIRHGRRVLNYRRTKRLPEARLHHTRCTNFAGHMQSGDLPDLFAKSYLDPHGPMFRELYEELSFSEAVKPQYLGVLYLTSSHFEQQHAGIVFDVNLSASNAVESLETTMHADVQFTDVSELMSTSENIDSWSRLLLSIVDGR